MLRFSAVFVAVCIVLISASLGAVLYLVAGFSPAESAIVAIAALAGLSLYNAVSTRVRDRGDVGDQLADLARGTADLARRLGEIDQRVATIESEVGRVSVAATDKARAASAPLAAEIGELGSLVKQLADSVAAHETVLVDITRQEVPAVPSAPAPLGAAVHEAPPLDAARTVDRAELGEPDAQSGRIHAGRFKGMERGDIFALIRHAVEDSRADLYLQPIVTLPQRKVRYYEAMTRLRTDDGEVLQPADYIGHAEDAGLMPAIDNLLVFRCVQLVRRLLSKNREVGLFCNISGSTLVDPAFFRQFSDFMEANRALAPAVVFEFSQDTVRHMGPIEHESLAVLSDLGYRFSMDRVTDLRIEPRDLAERGFRFIKVPATLLLNRAGASATDIHPADFSDLLGRYGIDLIAEKIESEGMVVDLLDYDVRFGQGFLFSPPRPVRSEALGAGERSDAPARSTPLAAGPAAEPAARRAPDDPPPDPRGGPDRRQTAISQIARSMVRRA